MRLGLFIFLGVLPMHLYEQQWTWNVAALGFVPFAMILAAFPGLFAWAAARTLRSFGSLPATLAIPVLWTGIEFFRGEVFFTGYPWLLLAHPLIDAPLLPLPAAIVGTYGVSFLVALTSGAAADVLWRKRPIPALVGLGALAATYATAIATAPRDDASGPRLRLAVVQTNIPQDNKNEWTPQQRFNDFQRFESLTRQAAAGKPDLIVWPETMFPGTALDPAAVAEQRAAVANLGADRSITLFTDRLCALQAEIRVPLMVGAIAVDGLRITGDEKGLHVTYGSLYNSVYMLREGAVQPGRYDKIDLTPFGEVMPYIQHWPWLQRQMMAVAAGGLTFDLSPGRGPVVFHSITVNGTAAILTPICFEATKPALCRRLVRAAGSAPRVLVNLTNDGWFGSFDPARWQHLQIARWRAVELHTPVVRAANTGVSALIDAKGHVIKAGVDGSARSARVDGVLAADMLLGVRPTIYSRIGDVFGWATLAATGLGLIATLRKPVKEAA